MTMTARPLVHKTAMPGLGLSAAITLAMLSIVVLLPIGLSNVLEVVGRERVAASLFLSFKLALLAAAFNLVFRVLLAWVLVRYRFPGKRLLDAAVDLPFALPTAVAGIALTALYAANGAFGSLAQAVGLKIAYTQAGIFIALVFVGLPFVTRTVQPVIEEIEQEVEEASATLGASRLYTLRHAILPMLMPAALTGFALALVRRTCATSPPPNSCATSSQRDRPQPCNSARAAPVAASVIRSPDSIRAISSTRSGGDSADTVDVVMSSWTDFDTRK